MNVCLELSFLEKGEKGQNGEDLFIGGVFLLVEGELMLEFFVQLGYDLEVIKQEVFVVGGEELWGQ